MEKKPKLTLEEVIKQDNSLALLESAEGLSIDTLLKLASLRSVTEKEHSKFQNVKDKKFSEIRYKDEIEITEKNDHLFTKVRLGNGALIIIKTEQFITATEELNAALDKEVIDTPNVTFDKNEFVVERYEDIGDKKKEKKKITVATPSIIKELSIYISAS